MLQFLKPGLILLLLLQLSLAQRDHFTGTGENCRVTVNIPKRTIRQCEQGLLPAGENELCSQYLSITSNQQAQLELLSRRVLELEDKLNQTKDGPVVQPPVTGLGTTYVRWGRTECPSTATLLHEGRYIGISDANQGSSFFCCKNLLVGSHRPSKTTRL